MKQLTKDILWGWVLFVLIILCVKAMINNWNLPVVRLYAGQCIEVIKDDETLPCSCIDLKNDLYREEYINYGVINK